MTAWTEDLVKSWLVYQGGVTVWDVDLEVFVCSAAVALVVVVEGFFLKFRSKRAVDVLVGLVIEGIVLFD